MTLTPSRTSPLPHNVSFHTATLDEVEQMIAWAADEGWNPGLDDAPAFRAADQDGFFIARHAGQTVAAISVVNHDETMAFLGLYLCHPDFRGKGIGLGLWTHALKHAGTRCVGLDGVAAQEANYAKSGFVRQGAITRMQGLSPNLSVTGTRPIDINRDHTEIAKLDTQANGYARPKFLLHWISDHTKSRKTVVAEQAGQLTGFATARLCHDGVKIGPIVAPDDETALALLQAAATALNAQQIIVDIPDCQVSLHKTLDALGYIATFETAHMFRGTPPKSSMLYRAVATMECG
ncbi:GNAT family N-acetyltransferase [Pacificibacter marinus]|uniref:N-acetyltransferase domain-containing protein n=1 Tax=Pacificibacter marinus TaxID=658057 RepID=A0A1Y5REC0_9RHOB|nr:GNAT family N-acetyltransferase [Pacificibacter marinus]SEK22303.1 Acetyltransferase (GNAT) domain-containing protein [Pacificibacter marinus]SLN15503.1 hypothetical protein PAM7971_00289 [Pacificibacter marinus]